MTAQPYRFTASVLRDPVLHALAPLHLPDQYVTLQLSVRRDDDGVWRARLRFTGSDERVRETAEIFCADSEAELWQAVHSLQDHQLRALYLSLA
jgi:hypothetical protein